MSAGFSATEDGVSGDMEEILGKDACGLGVFIRLVLVSF